MKAKVLPLIGILSIFFLVLPSFVFASDAAILERLQKMENEINRLKSENAQLRNMLENDKKDLEAENASLKEMVQTDRREIEEIKKSAGKLSSKGLRTVLGKYDMELYGRVKVDINYDFADFDNNDWVRAVGVGGENDSTNFNPRDTRFGLKVRRRDDQWLSEARIETDFYGSTQGNNLDLRMRLAYVKITNDDWKASLTIGQDYVPIARLMAPTIDFGFMCNAGNLWWRVPQITLRKNVGNFEFLVGAMRHRRRATNEGARPWALGRIAYTNGFLGKGGLLAIGGGFVNGEVTNNFGRDNDVDKWLLALELKLKFGKFTFQMEPWIGEGIDSEFLRYDMGINPRHNRIQDLNRRPDTIRSRGGFVSLAYKATPRLSFAMAYGIDDPDGDDMEGMKGTLNGHMFTRNEMFLINTWYSVTSAVKMGFEIMYVETERFSSIDNGVRTTFSTIYSF